MIGRVTALNRCDNLNHRRSDASGEGTQQLSDLDLQERIDWQEISDQNLLLPRAGSERW